MDNFSLQLKAYLDTKNIDKQLKTLSEQRTIHIKTNGKEVETVTRKLQDDMGKVYTHTEKINKATGKSTQNLKYMAKESNKMNQSFAGIVGKVGKFLLATTIIGGFTSAIYEAGRSIKELDSSLVELRKVTDLNGDSLKQYKQDTYELARELRTTASAVTDATTEFAKSGYTVEESLELSKTAIMFQAIADEAITSADSANMLISVMQGFKKEASESENIINAINETSNNYAISSGQLSENLSKVSSSAQLAGVGFEELLGLMTAGVTTTRNASKTANALKSIFVNLQQMGEDGELPRLEEQFNQFGVTLVKNNGEIKDAFTILNELANAQKNLSNVSEKNQFRTLLEDIGGKYNINTLVAILDNFNIAVNATGTALNSFGSASREFETSLDSIEKKTERIKGLFQEFVTNGFIPELGKDILDLGGDILKFANSDLGQATLKAILLSTTLLTLPKIIGGIITKVTALKGTVALLGLSLSSTAITIGALVGAFYLLEKATNLTSDQLKRQKDLLKENEEEIKNVQKEYDTLSKIGEDNLNKAEKARLKYLEEQLGVLKEQNVERTKSVARALENDFSTTLTTRGRKRNIKGFSAVQEEIEQSKKLEQQLNAETITNVDYINKQKEKIDSLNKVYDAYYAVLQAGGSLSPNQRQLFDEITILRAGYVDLGGSIEGYQDKLNSLNEDYFATTDVTEIFKDSLKQEGDIYQWVSQEAKNSAIAILQAEKDKTSDLIKQQQLRLEATKQEVEQSNKMLSLMGIAPNFTNQGFAPRRQELMESALTPQQKRLANLNAQLEKLGNISVSGNGGGNNLSLPKSSASKSPALKSTEDRYKENVEKQIAYLKYQLDMDKITQEQYYQKLNILNHKYYKGKKKYLEDYRKYEVEVYNGLQKVQEENIKKNIDRLNAQQTLLEDYARKQQDNIQKEIDALDAQNEKLETQIEYEELLDNLQKAKASRVYLYKKGEGFIYTEDTEKVKEAEKALEDFNRNQALEEQKKKLEEQKDAWGDFVQNFKDEQDRYNAEQLAGKGFTKNILDGKLKDFAEYVKVYERLQQQLMQAQTMEQQQQAGGGNLSSWNSMIVGKYKYIAVGSDGKLHGSNVSKDKAVGIANGTIKPSKPSKKHATGSKFIPMSEYANVNENGAELFIPPSGNMKSLEYGTGIVPKTMAENIMDIGKYSLPQLVEKIKSSSSTEAFNITTGNWVFPNIDNQSSATNLFSEIKRLAIQTSFKGA